MYAFFGVLFSISYCEVIHKPVVYDDYDSFNVEAVLSFRSVAVSNDLTYTDVFTSLVAAKFRDVPNQPIFFEL